MTKPALKTRVIVRPECDPDQEYAGIVYEVAEHPRGKYVIVEAIGNGALYAGAARSRRLKIDPVMLTTDVPDDYDKHTSATMRPFPLYPLYHVGEVFTVPADVLPGVDESTLMVITGLAGTSHNRSYQAATLGGDFDRDGDRWFKKVAAAAIRQVPLAEIRRYL